jgi:hypothetical protein
MNRSLLMIGVLCAAATSAHAQRWPDTLRMSCDQVASLVRTHGGLTLGTGPHVRDRYVTSCAYCPSMSMIVPSWVQTADNPQCFVGYRCDTDEPSRGAGIAGGTRCGAGGYSGP